MGDTGVFNTFVPVPATHSVWITHAPSVESWVWQHTHWWTRKAGLCTPASPLLMSSKCSFVLFVSNLGLSRHCILPGVLLLFLIDRVEKTKPNHSTFLLRSCSVFFIQIRWQRLISSWRGYCWHLLTSCPHSDRLLPGRTLVTLRFLIDCPSGFTFHFSLAFLGFSSIFLGFLFHLAEVYFRFYYCFAETALCRNSNVLICMLKSLFHQTVEADVSLIAAPLKITPSSSLGFQDFRIGCATLDSCQMSLGVVHPLWHLKWICHSITAWVLFLRYKPRLS